MERNASLSTGKNTLQILNYFTFLSSFTLLVFNKFFSKGAYKGTLQVSESNAWYNRDGSVNTAG